MSTPYAAAETDRPTYPEVKAEFGEDPARYLAVDENDLEDEHPLALAHARIRAIDDHELLKEWQRIEAEHWGRREVMAHLDARERELTDAPIATDATADPVPATDGGTVTETPSEPEESDADDLHPDVKGIEAGHALVLEREESTEYIFPATPACDEPYLLRAFDAEGDERTAEPMGMTFDEVLARLDGSPDPVPVAEIDVNAPRDAASNGGDAQ